MEERANRSCRPVRVRPLQRPSLSSFKWELTTRGSRTERSWVKLGGNALLRPNVAVFAVALGIFMSENAFAGQMVLEWFTLNRTSLESQRFVIHQILSNPEARWIEPTVFIGFETPFFVGEIEMTIDGRCCYRLLPQNSSGPDIVQCFLCLEPAALEYRKRDWYSGNMADVNIEPCYEIYQISDYDPIFEPIISKSI